MEPIYDNGKSIDEIEASASPIAGQIGRNVQFRPRADRVFSMKLIY
ncbi:MAG: hypothetical protein J0I53_05530 [Chryseobacterium sp.]|nr:hypothetical protein [Chryseobacterium sp.]